MLRYVDHVVGSPSSLRFRFSQGVLTAFDVDVVHVADPNLDLLLGTRGANGYQRLLAALVFVRNLRRHGIALVRTLHPSDKTRLGRARVLAHRLLDRAATAFVTLDESTESPDPARTTVIRHPHFRERYVGYPRGEMVRGRMLCVSAAELPAQATGLLGVPRITDTEGVTLRLAGTASNSLESAIRSALAQHPAVISARLEQLSDGAQVQEISSAELVVLPKLETLSDLQLAFVVLSLDRPVLVPRTEAMSRLAEEVGPGWVHMVDGPITAETIDEAFMAIRAAGRAPRPTFDGRDLATTHAAYEELFRAAASEARRR